MSHSLKNIRDDEKIISQDISLEPPLDLNNADLIETMSTFYQDFNNFTENDLSALDLDDPKLWKKLDIRIPDAYKIFMNESTVITEENFEQYKKFLEILVSTITVLEKNRNLIYQKIERFLYELNESDESDESYVLEKLNESNMTNKFRNLRCIFVSLLIKTTIFEKIKDHIYQKTMSTKYGDETKKIIMANTVNWSEFDS